MQTLRKIISRYIRCTTLLLTLVLLILILCFQAGRIFAGTHPEYYGYTFDSGEQMRFFKPMLTDKSLRLVQVGIEPVNVMKVTKKTEKKTVRRF